MKPYARWVRAVPLYSEREAERLKDCFVQVSESDGRTLTGPVHGVEGEWLNDRVLALLKRIEWRAKDGFGCPNCDMYRHVAEGEHDADCELAALIRELS